MPPLFLAVAILGVALALVGAWAARSGGEGVFGRRPDHRWTNTRRLLGIAAGLYVTTWLVGGLALSLRPTESLIVRTVVGSAYLVVPALVVVRAVLGTERQPVSGVGRHVALGLAGALAAFGLAFFLLQGVQLVGAPWGWEPQEQNVVQVLRAARGHEAAFLVGYALVMAPCVEEVLYRGLVLPALARNMNVHHALLLQALIFGAMHFLASPSQLPLMLPLAAVGWCAGYLYFRTGSLLCAVLVHAGFNGVQLLALFLAPA